MATVWICNKSQLWMTMWALRLEHVAGSFEPRRSWQAHHKSSLLGTGAYFFFFFFFFQTWLLISEKSLLMIWQMPLLMDFSVSTSAMHRRFFMQISIHFVYSIFTFERVSCTPYCWTNYRCIWEYNSINSTGLMLDEVQIKSEHCLHGFLFQQVAGVAPESSSPWSQSL